VTCVRPTFSKAFSRTAPAIQGYRRSAIHQEIADKTRLHRSRHIAQSLTSGGESPFYTHRSEGQAIAESSVKSDSERRRNENAGKSEAEQRHTIDPMGHRADYGYDAPYMLVIFGLLTLATGIGAAATLLHSPIRAAAPITFDFVFLLSNTGSFFYTTRRGKFIEWNRILDRLRLCGHEVVLDMGCGRGAVLTAVARRLTTGQATGIDIWSTKDQSGNAKDVTVRNASMEGVGDRVQIDTGDMRALPYPDATFDLVVSSLAIHNIRSNADRRLAITEGFRVLKSGGRMVIADIRATAIYEDALQTIGALNVERRCLGWRFWWGNPIACTTLLTASKSVESVER
jgi:arsenite methyltransferase